MGVGWGGVTAQRQYGGFGKRGGEQRVVGWVVTHATEARWAARA